MTPRKRKTDEEQELSSRPRVSAPAALPAVPRRREPEIVEEAFDNKEDMLAQLSEEYGTDDLRVEVFLVNDKTNETARVGKYNYPGEFDPDVIAKKFGGGKYRYIVKDEHGVISKKFSLTYAKPVEAMAVPGSDMNEKIIEMLEKRIADNEEKSKDNVNQMTSMFTMMLTMMEKNNQLVIGTMQSKKDPLEDILKYKQLFGSDDGLSKLEKVISVLTTGAKLGEQYADKGDGGGGGIVEQIIAGISAVMAGRAANPNTPSTLGNALEQVRDVVTDGLNRPPAQPPNPQSAEPVQEIMDPVEPRELDPNEPPPPMSVRDYVLSMVSENIGMLKLQSSMLKPEAAAKTLGEVFRADGYAWDVSVYFRKGGVREVVTSFPELRDIAGWLDAVSLEYIKLFEPKVVPGPAPKACPEPEPKIAEQPKPPEAAPDAGTVSDTPGHTNPA